MNLRIIHALQGVNFFCRIVSRVFLILLRRQKIDKKWRVTISERYFVGLRQIIAINYIFDVLRFILTPLYVLRTYLLLGPDE